MSRRAADATAVAQPDALGNPRLKRRTLAAAEKLHAAAIHLLTRVSAEDAKSGVAPARLSALAVLTFAGPQTVGELARMEGVRSPTMTRVVHALEAAGLAQITRSADDARRAVVSVSDAGRALVETARQRRLEVVAARLATLSADEIADVARVAAILDERFGFGASPHAGATQRSGEPNKRIHRVSRRASRGPREPDVAKRA